MNLIYAKPDKIEIDVLKDYEFDLAYGVDENNFTLQLALTSHCYENDYLIYMIDTQNGFEEGAEYGGIIDVIESDTKNLSVVYSGRPWQGVFVNKVIEPPPRFDYLTVTRNAYTVILNLINTWGLADLFAAKTSVSDIFVNAYTFNRYTDGYIGISKMLADDSGKLKMIYAPGVKKVVVFAFC